MIPNSESVFFLSTTTVIVTKRLGQELGGKKMLDETAYGKNFLSTCYLPLLGTSVRKKCLTHSSSKYPGKPNNLSIADLRNAAVPLSPKLSREEVP